MNIFEKEKKLEEISKSVFQTSSVGSINPFVKSEDKKNLKINCNFKKSHIPTVDDVKPTNQPTKETKIGKVSQKRGKGRGCI